MSEELVVDYVETAPVQEVASTITALAQQQESWITATVESDEAFGRAAVGLGTISELQKRATAARMKITRPLDAAKREALALFRPALDRMAEIDGHLRREMGAWKAKKERLAHEAARKEADESARLALAEAEAEGDALAAESLEKRPVVVEPLAPVAPPAAKGVTFRKRWGFRIVDPAAIPRQFLVVDERALQAMAVSLKERAAVPGVEFYATEEIARTGR